MESKKASTEDRTEHATCMVMHAGQHDMGRCMGAWRRTYLNEIYPQQLLLSTGH